MPFLPFKRAMLFSPASRLYSKLSYSKWLPDYSPIQVTWHQYMHLNLGREGYFAV